MSKRLRFYHNGEMVVKSLEELILGKNPELSKVSPMFSTGLEVDETPVFEEDILSLKLSDVPPDSNFWNQEIAKVMKASNMNEVILHFFTNKFNHVEFRLHMKRDELWGSHNTVKQEKSFHESRLYAPCFTGMPLPYLMVFSGAKIIGNSLEHPQLLPGEHYSYC
ncbi:hypothetical protein JMA_39810 (plasmid) [Jeotgalibacillus malaysiensis]|uniref:Uncharacterized protein n=1 Tax=Jeotgalibacillus malaysiensis TaxID=1508404 RepID=A0A0B5AZD4_9BACL|nr:hypothetical protein [Jeotgalibacillus malaysiensis]AJD93299.1 hypothetical protein JMA_39810 [Jeotgalibacillus malaysiensis]